MEDKNLGIGKQLQAADNAREIRTYRMPFRAIRFCKFSQLHPQIFRQFRLRRGTR